MSYHVLTGMMTLGGPGSGIEGHTTPKEKEDPLATSTTPFDTKDSDPLDLLKWIRENK